MAPSVPRPVFATRDVSGNPDVRDLHSIRRFRGGGGAVGARRDERLSCRGVAPCVRSANPLAREKFPRPVILVFASPAIP